MEHRTSWPWAETGICAIGMLPPYPSKTFPAHYSIVTGLYPENHGIVGNRFYDPSRQEVFDMGQDIGRQARWYGGTPLWTLAEKLRFLSTRAGSSGPTRRWQLGPTHRASESRLA